MSEPVYLNVPNLPRILLIDCADELYESLGSDGYAVSQAYSGDFAGRPAPPGIAALHETDVLIIDWDPGFERAVSGPDEATSGRKKAALFERFKSCYGRGAFAICFLDERFSPWESLGFLPGATTHSPGASVDKHPKITKECVQYFPDLARLFQDNAADLKQHRSLVSVRPSYALLRNEADEVKALFEPIDDGGIFFLPRFDRKVIAVRRLLRDVLPKMSPELFPERVDDWLAKDEYQSSTVVAVRRSIDELKKEYESSLVQLRGKEEAARREHTSMLDLLTAESHDLRRPVKDALELLGFDVRDMDVINSEAGRNPEEDLQIKRDGYFAVVEVTSGKGNAREKDLQDLLKYQRRRAKEPGREDVEGLDVSGLLVMNQYVLQEPMKRPRLYEGNEQSQALARDMDITVMSTWDLFQLVRSVEEGRVSKEDARRSVETPGVVELGPDLDSITA
jgi:hypothetical protein